MNFYTAHALHNTTRQHTDENYEQTSSTHKNQRWLLDIPALFQLNRLHSADITYNVKVDIFEPFSIFINEAFLTQATFFHDAVI